MKSTYLKLDYSVIQEKFPLTVEKIFQWFCTREDIIRGVMESEDETVRMEDLRKMMENVVPVIVQHDPRKLYEFFDDSGVIIYIGGHPDTGEKFTYYNSKHMVSKVATTRVEAEHEAFMDAFLTLEKELNG